MSLTGVTDIPIRSRRPPFLLLFSFFLSSKPLVCLVSSDLVLLCFLRLEKCLFSFLVLAMFSCLRSLPRAPSAHPFLSPGAPSAHRSLERRLFTRSLCERRLLTRSLCERRLLTRSLSVSAVGSPVFSP